MKRIIIYTLILLLLMFIPTITRAGVVDDVLNSGDQFLESGKDSPITVEGIKLKNASDDIYYILLYTGIVLSVIIGAVIGIKIIIASAEEKAKVKEALVPYVIGCVVIFGAFGIWKLAIGVFNSMS